MASILSFGKCVGLVTYLNEAINALRKFLGIWFQSQQSASKRQDKTTKLIPLKVFSSSIGLIFASLSS